MTDSLCDPLFPKIQLRHGWEGWWSKIEMFDPVYQIKEDHIVYFDLDTVILDNIDDLMNHQHPIIGLKPFNKYKRKINGYMASGMLGWKNDGTLKYLADEFEYKKDTLEYQGDQDYITEKLGEHKIHPVYWQELVDGIGSFKRNVHFKKQHPFRVVCFHGEPRPDLKLINQLKRAYENPNRK